MALVQIRMKDRVFARALNIVLSESRISTEVTEERDAKVPDDCGLVITDLYCAGRDVLRFEKTFFIVKGQEQPPEDKVYYRRPFLIDVFSADVRNALFSEEKKTEIPKTLSVDKKRSVARYGGFTAQLTETELKLLCLLYENKGKTVTNAEIIANVFDGKTVEGSNVSAVYVNYLRKKLDEQIGKRFIYSVRGKGYVLKL